MHNNEASYRDIAAEYMSRPDSDNRMLRRNMIVFNVRGAFIHFHSTREQPQGEPVVPPNKEHHSPAPREATLEHEGAEGEAQR